ncbi:hypothetical protein [Paraburkholderia terrae]|uniref:hypothetical protein n=1 Tax=Paraburkholderia terrae TaxID=311230 RepID=UPI003365AD36
MKILIHIYVDINDVRDYTPKHNGFVAAATGAKSANGGGPMLLRLSIAQRFVKEVHTALRIAARLASAFTPPSSLAPVPHEALCYGCMVGIVVPAHHHIASSEIPRDDLDIELNKAPPLCPTETNLVTAA